MSVLPHRCFNTAGALAAAALIIPSALSAQQIDPARDGELHFRHIGPLGNRVSSVAGVPGDRFTYFAGAATGGIWKTEDAGLHWRPVFDDQPVHSIGALAVAPSGRGDGVRWPAMLAQRIGYLAGTIQTADFPPTDAQREVHQALRERLVRYQGQFDELMSTDLAEFNRLLQERSVPPIIS